jgi:hypothetical protein
MTSLMMKINILRTKKKILRIENRFCEKKTIFTNKNDWTIENFSKKIIKLFEKNFDLKEKKEKKKMIFICKIQCLNNW